MTVGEIAEVRSKKLEIRSAFTSYFSLLNSYFLLILILLTPITSFSRPVMADLAMRKIEIDSGFTGTDILLFGARNDPGDIIVVIRGPEKSYIVRKKERVAVVWVNKKQMVFDNIYGFNVVASNRPLDEFHNDYLLENLHISTGLASMPPATSEDETEFEQALLEKQQKSSLYLPNVEEISFIGDTLFRTVIHFPANIARGVYTAEIYLFSDGQLSGIQSTPIIVSKNGIDATIYDFAYEYPLLYGLLSVFIALFAGWAASVIFRRV